MHQRGDVKVKTNIFDSPDEAELDITIADPDSPARTHLANERTFLAWLRTGITLITLGLAIAHFLDVEALAGVVAIFLVLAGGVLIVTGRQRFLRSQRMIERRDALTDNRDITLATVLVLIVGLSAIGIIVFIELS